MGLEAICWSATSPSTIIFIRRWGIRFCNCERKKSWLLLWKMTTKEWKRRSKVLPLVSTDLITTLRLKKTKEKEGKDSSTEMKVQCIFFPFTFNFSLKWSYWCPFLKLYDIKSTTAKGTAEQYSGLRGWGYCSPFLSSSLMPCYKTRRALNLITRETDVGHVLKEATKI